MDCNWTLHTMNDDNYALYYCKKDTGIRIPYGYWKDFGHDYHMLEDMLNEIGAFSNKPTEEVTK